MKTAARLFQQDAERAFDALGPAFHRTDRCLAPVDGTHELAHLAAPGSLTAMGGEESDPADRSVLATKAPDASQR